MDNHLFLAIGIIGLVSLIGIFLRMKPGFGPFTFKVYGLTLVLVLSGLIGAVHKESLNAVIGIFGAVAGYLFAVNSKA